MAINKIALGVGAVIATALPHNEETEITEIAPVADGLKYSVYEKMKFQDDTPKSGQERRREKRARERKKNR